jgi:hypothetical protein
LIFVAAAVAVLIILSSTLSCSAKAEHPVIRMLEA